MVKLCDRSQWCTTSLHRIRASSTALADKEGCEELLFRERILGASKFIVGSRLGARLVTELTVADC